MPDQRKPTPIRKRASAPKSEPKPLIFPPPNRDITVVQGVSHAGNIPSIANLPSTQRDLTARLVARLIYKIVSRVMENDIIGMGEAQFEAFCLSLMEDMD